MRAGTARRCRICDVDARALRQGNVVNAELKAAQRLGACNRGERSVGQHREVGRRILEYAEFAFTQMASMRCLRKVTVLWRGPVTVTTMS